MKLRTKIMMMVAIPLILVAILASFVGFFQIKSLICNKTLVGMKETLQAFGASLNSISDDDFAIDADGSFTKGDFDVIKSGVFDRILSDSDFDISIFDTDSCVYSTIDGDTVVGLPWEEDFKNEVVVNAQSLTDKGYKFGSYDYIVYIMPIINDTKSEVVGAIMISEKSSILGWDTIKALSGISLSFIIISVILFILDYLLIVKMTRDLRSSVEALDNLAAGKLNADVNRKALSRQDEIGSVLRAVLNLRGQMREVIGAIISESDVVLSSAEQISDETSQSAVAINQVDLTVVEISEGANNQATETQRATENVIYMGDMIEQTKNQVENLQLQTKIMKESGEEASNTLSELEEINQRTKEAIDIIYEQTNTTNASAIRIQEVTGLIAGIAEETNLLSLNAAIEAARAGEQGRGFAVVASQIQKLAEQSNESTKEIEEIVNNLLIDSEKAVGTMNNVKKIMEEQNRKVESTDQAFSKVKDGITTSIKSVDEIREKTSKLNEARGNVIDIVQSLTAIAEENAASTEETSASVSEVSGIITDIADNAKHMKSVANDLKNKTGVFSM